MAVDKILADIQSLSPEAIIELFILDFNNYHGGGNNEAYILRFHGGTNELNQNIVWGGKEYTALPIEAEGFDVSTQGTLPRPKIRLANPNGAFSAQLAGSDDLVGAKIIRKRTIVKYLDAVNFPGGVNPTADPNQAYPDDIWYVEQKLSENRFVIEWELASALDLHGVMLPGRQVIQNSCPWKYRGVECGYSANTFFDSNDQPVGTLMQDVCGKRLSSCKVRQDGFTDKILPFGGFPGALRYD